VIENVPGSPMRADFRLCGCQFGLDLRRVIDGLKRVLAWHRFDADMPPSLSVVSVVGHGTPTWVRERLGYNPTIADYRVAMGIDWMNRDELSQAIPPAYTEFVGRQVLAHFALAVA
jgi:DNA (cytosine-5)-methyltransferase 1